MIVSEGKARIKIGGGAFFNPSMRLNRDLSSLAVGAIGKIEDGKNGRAKKLEALDGFCASGIRGIRYKLENENVGKVSFLDANKLLAALIEKNAARNGIKKAQVFSEDFCKAAYSNSFDFVELDPFGSPMPFVYDAVRSFSMRKAGVLSVTATDTAVLCGAKHDACIKNYGSVPLNNEFCHENAIRILLSFIARAASQFNFAIRPLVCFSKRHYVKCILRLEFGAGQAVESAKLANYFVLYCPGCLERKLVKATGLIGNSGLFGEGNKCRACGHVLQIAGPLWAGKLAEKEFVQKMAGLNAKRGLECWEEVAMLLDVLENEADMPAFSYDLHRIFKVKRLGSVPNLDVIEMLKKDGYAASLTHFSPTSIKTDAPAAQVVRAVGMLGKKAGK